MCRGLPLVVAKFPHKWFYRRLSLRLLLSLFCDQTTDKRRREHFLVFWLHAHHGVPFLPPNRINGFLRLFLVHPQNLLCRQSGLNTLI